MRALALPLCGLLFIAGQAHSADQRMLDSIKKLDPEEQLEQRCDVEAMDRISHDKTGYKPDKVIAYTFGDPAIKGLEMKAGGASFRSRGKWYRLKFTCRTGPEHMRIEAFDYKIGAAVPHSDWQKYYLTD